MNSELEQIKNNFFSNDPQLMRSATQRCIELKTVEVVDFLISLLDLDDPEIRNEVAIALEEIADQKALIPLLNTIFKKENFNYNGTIAWALQPLDCSQHLKEIFQILFYQSFESKLSAFNILEEQEFEFTKTDLDEILEMWEGCKLHPDQCSGYGHEKTRLMMQQAVDWYKDYLINPMSKTE